MLIFNCSTLASTGSHCIFRKWVMYKCVRWDKSRANRIVLFCKIWSLCFIVFRGRYRLPGWIYNFLDLVFKYFACLYNNFRREFPFFKIFSTKAVLLSVCSRSTPRYLMAVFDVITLFPQEIANLECFDSICLVPNRINFFSPRWRDNLLSISQLLRDNKLSPKTFSMFFLCFPDTSRAESSA